MVRLAPIKDIKTLIYSFYELKFRLEKVRLHIIGPEDDKQYAQECYELVRQLGVKDVLFPGMVNVLEYMKKLDFTVLTSISEGQPLSVLESFAAGRPCVTTDVGCCRNCLTEWRAMSWQRGLLCASHGQGSPLQRYGTDVSACGGTLPDGTDREEKGGTILPP